MRAFDCAVLVLVPDKNDNNSPDKPDTLLQLLRSCLELGGEYAALCRTMLSSVMGMSFPDGTNYEFAAFALLASLVLSEPRCSAECEKAVRNWFYQSHLALMPQHIALDPKTNDFLQIPFATILAERWATLAAEVAAESDVADELAPVIRSAARGASIEKKVRKALGIINWSRSERKKRQD
jgi:hypothetical protein